MRITEAQYVSSDSITAVIDGVRMNIPVDPENRHYMMLLDQNVMVADPPVVSLQTLRSFAHLERADFCIALADADIITDAEAISAAKGEWPSSFAGFLDYLDEKQGRSAQITWASCVTIQRNHEFVLLLAWWKNISDDELDRIFKVDTSSIENAL